MNESSKISQRINAINEDISKTSINKDHFHKYQIDFQGNGKTIVTANGINHIHMVTNHELSLINDHTHTL